MFCYRDIYWLLHMYLCSIYVLLQRHWLVTTIVLLQRRWLVTIYVLLHKQWLVTVCVLLQQYWLAMSVFYFRDIDWSPFDVNVIASCSVDTYAMLWDVRDPKRPTHSFQSVCMYMLDVFLIVLIIANLCKIFMHSFVHHVLSFDAWIHIFENHLCINV